MNNFAISSDGIATALQDSASALMEGGNNLEQATALIAAANKVVQDPNSVGSALRTISLRLRGTSIEELEEMGEDVEGAVEGVSKMQEKIKALSGVDIIDMNGAYKDTYTILREIGAVWKEMSDIDQAALLELMAGKNRANTLAAILGNMEDLSGAYETAMNAEGSALRENETYLNSIQGRIDLLKNSAQTLAMNLLNSDAVKWFVDLGTTILDLANNKFAVLIAAVSGFVLYLSKIKKLNPFQVFQDINNKMFNMDQAASQVRLIKNFDMPQFEEQRVKEYGMAIKDLTDKQKLAVLTSEGLTNAEKRAALAHAGVTDEKMKEILAEEKLVTKKNKSIQINGLFIAMKSQELALGLDETSTNWLVAHSTEEVTKEMLAQAVVRGQLTHKQAASILLSQREVQANIQHASSLKGLIISFKSLATQHLDMVFMIAAMAVSQFINNLETASDKMEKLREEYDKLQSSISDAKGNISSLESEINDNQQKINDLQSKDKLTLDDAEELQLLKEKTAELEKNKELQEKILQARTDQNKIKSLTMINSLLENTAAGQQAAVESGEKWGKTIGAVAGALAAVAAVTFAPVTGGASLAAGGALAAGAGATTFGALIGGGMVGGAIGSKIGGTVGSQLKSAGDDLISWYESYEEAITKAQQQATEAESKYLTDMSDKNYEAWQNKVEAVNTLQTEMYDGLQQMQEYISNLDYNSQNASIIDEYNSLMTHIDVKSNEGNISGQISSIQSLQSEYDKLSKGVDENGRNIALSAEEYARYCSIVEQVVGYTPQLIQGYDAEGNAILNRNSLLEDSIALLQEQRRIEAQKLTNDQSILDTYTNAKANYNIQTEGTTSGIKLNSDISGDFMSALEKLVGDEQDLLQSDESFILEHMDVISSKWSEVMSLSEKYNGTEYTNALKEDLNNAVSQMKYAEGSFDEFKQLLFTVPESSEYYNQLSGKQLEFLNTYVQTYSDVKDLTDDEVLSIRNSILSLTDDIATNEYAGKLVDSLLSVNESWSVKKYRDRISSLLDELVSIDVINEDERNLIYKQFIPDDKDIDLMINEVKNKLSKGDKKLAESFSLSELKLAYRVVADVDEISFVDLKKAVDTEMGKFRVSFKTYTSLSSDVENFNTVFAQTAEVASNNTKVTQEYKDALIELVGDQDAVNECFYKSDQYVVQNAAALQELVEASRDNITANIELAKSQSRFQYSELVQQLGDICDQTRNLTDEEIANAHATMDQIDAVQQAIYKYQLLETQLNAAGGAFEKFNQAKEVDALNTTGNSYIEMAQTVYDAFYKTGEVGTQAFDAAVQALVPDSVYASLESDGDKLKAIYKYFNNKVLPSLTLDNDALSITQNDIEDFVDKGLSKGLLSGSKSNGLKIVDEMNLEKGAKLMGMTEASLTAMLAELDKYDYNTGAESFLSQIDDSFDSQVMSTTSKLQKLNEQKLALLENGGYEKNKKQINEINAEIDKCGGSLDKLQTKAVDSYEAYANNQGVIESLNTIDDKTQKISDVMDKQTAMEIGLDWDESKNLTVQEALDDILAKQTELEEPTELMIQFAQEGLTDEIDGLIAKIEKDKKVKLDIEYDSESGEYNIEDSQYLKRNADGKIELTGNLKNDDNAKQLVKQINLLESLQNFADNGMVTTEELLSNISETLNSLHKAVTGDPAPGEDGRKKNKGAKDLSDIDSKKEFSDTEKEIQNKKSELAELKKKHKELKNKAAAGDENAVKKQKKNAKEIKAIEEELAQLRKANMNDYLKQIDNLSKVDKQTIIETAVDYQKGDQSFDDLMEKINSIEDKKVRLQVIAKLTESGAFDELFENADTIDKTVIIKAITQGTDNVDLLNEVISHLPEEVQPEVRALVDGALDNIEIVDGKLKLVDGKTSTANVNVDTENAQEQIDYWERKIDNIDEVDPIELGLKEDATNDEKIAAIQKKIDKLKKESKIDVTVGEKDSSKGSGKKNLKDEEQKLAQLKSEKDKLGYQTKNKDINKIGPWLAKSYEYNKQKEIVIPLRIEKYQEDFEKIDNLVEEDRTIAINAITKYENGGSIEDLMSELSSIEDEDVRLEVIATLTKDGAFDELLSDLDEGDKEIIIHALTKGKGDVNELNNIIDSLPPEVQSQVRALVDGALSNLNVVDGKLQEVDNTKPTPTVDVNDNASSTLGTLLTSMSTLSNMSASPKVSVAVTGLTLLQRARDLINKLKGDNGVNGTAHVMGTAWVGGTALKGGKWGAKKTETALVGELGPEMVVRGDHWFTVGDQGAEFRNIQRGDIIFNHKQTEEIFKNGYITSRGKIAKVNGTAHAQGTTPTKGSSWAEGTAYALWRPGSGNSGSKNKQIGKAKTKQGKTGNTSKGVKDFEEIFDWFEIKLEEINEQLDLMGAQLKNAVTFEDKNGILDDMIAQNKSDLNTLAKGYKLYNNYSNRLLKKIPKKYRDEAKNGKIAIEEFKGKTDDETLQKIKNYREWAQKAADLKKQIQEVNAEIADLAKQKFDNIEEAYNNMIEVYNRNPINRIQNYIDLTEEKGYIASAKSYEEMIRQEQAAQENLKTARDEMQKSLDESVKQGVIQKESPQWWDAVKAIQAMNEEIDAAELNIEKYNNAINDIKWKVFDTTISRIDGLSNETQNLIDLMGDVEDAVKTPERESGWGANEVEWTKEGLTSLGLYAQQMEIAQEKAKQYQKAIEDLDKDYAAGKYSENEYYEKLAELKDGQYDAIKSYHDAKDAIVELNEARIDAIKEGIEKEIQSYQELIDKKKEELSAEKD